MTTTIEIKKLEIVDGISKKNDKAYTLYKIQGVDGNYYSLFKNKGNEAILEGLRKDMVLVAETEPGQRAKQFNITRIISKSLIPATPKISQAQKQEANSSSVDEAGLPASLSDEQILNLIRNARIITASEFRLQVTDVDSDNPAFQTILQAKLQQQSQQHALAMAKYIQLQKQRNMGVFR